MNTLRRNILVFLAGLGPALLLPGAHAQSAVRSGVAPLKVGVHPYNSTLALIATHRPLVQYLSRMLAREVEFYTAADFDTYLKAVLAGEYDVAICPPHFAVLAMEKDYLPLFHYKSRLEPILAVPSGSGLNAVNDFRGKIIAMAEPSAFIRIAMVKWLEDRGLRAGGDYRIVEKPTHGAAIAAVTLGEADAGLATKTTLRQVPIDVRQQLRAVSFGLNFPHMATLAHRRLGEAGVAAVRTALQAFPEAAEGREFFGKMEVGGYDVLTADDLHGLEPYVKYQQQLMRGR